MSNLNVLKQALEALIEARPVDSKQAQMQLDSITALRTAIEQAEKADVEQSSTQSKETFDQPVAYQSTAEESRLETVPAKGTLLYTHPARELEQAEKAEPFGYFKYDMRLDAWVMSRHATAGIPFYTHPAREQPTQQEPVACIGTNGELMWLKKPTVVYSKPQPLFAHPAREPQCPYVISTREGTHHCSLSNREPLTEAQIWQLVNDCSFNRDLHADKFARAIEKAHGIGEKE